MIGDIDIAGFWKCDVPHGVLHLYIDSHLKFTLSLLDTENHTILKETIGKTSINIEDNDLFVRFGESDTVGLKIKVFHVDDNLIEWLDMATNKWLKFVKLSNARQ
jgi:hypothetical protein